MSHHLEDSESSSEASAPSLINADHLASFAASIALLTNESEESSQKATMGDLVGLMQEHADVAPESEKERSYGAILCEKEFAKQKAEDAEKNTVL